MSGRERLDAPEYVLPSGRHWRKDRALPVGSRLHDLELAPGALAGYFPQGQAGLDPAFTRIAQPARPAELHVLCRQLTPKSAVAVVCGLSGLGGIPRHR